MAEINAETEVALKAQQAGTAEAEAAKIAADKAAANKAALPPITIDTKPAEIPESELNKELSKTLTGAGYTEESLQERLTKDGGISEEFITELKGKVDPDFVDAHVGRIRAEIDLAKVKKSGELDTVRAKEKVIKDMNDHIYSTVGGEDKFKTLSETLKAELSSDELAALNVKLASGNKIVVTEGLQAAVKKYNDIRGMGGPLMEGDAQNGVPAPEHITKEEFSALMRTDKYKTDPVYQRKVDADRLKTRAEDAKNYGPGSYYGFHPTKGRYNL